VEPVCAVGVQLCAPAMWISHAFLLYGLLSSLSGTFGNSRGEHWRWSWQRYEGEVFM